MEIKKKNPWLLIKNGFNPAIEREVETILSIGNGFIGSRNSLEENYRYSNPGTYIAGVYDRVQMDFYNQLIKNPDWARIFIFIEGNVLTLDENDFIEHKRYLDFKDGLAVREWQSVDKDGRITDIKIIKFVSLYNKHEVYKSITVTPINYSGKIKIQTGIDASLINFKNINFDKESKSNVITMCFSPHNSKKQVSISQKSNFKSLSNDILINYQKEFENNFLYEEFEWYADIENNFTINSLLAIYTNIESKTPLIASKEHLKNTDEYFYKNALQNHINKWNTRWKESEVLIEGDEKAQKWVNFALYHLITSGEFSGDNVSIPARNLSGEAYKGHIFWDTEMFVLPFFIFTKPDIAKSLLLYRYNTLNGARKNARKEGFQGASFAWESTDSGKEMAPSKVILPDDSIIYIRSGEMENHISQDISYAIYQYWQATGDDDFIIKYGAEIIFETARFSKSLLKEGADSFYHINNVIGPDEYHENVNDNAYTNIMTKFNLEIAYKVALWLKKINYDEYKKIKNKLGLKSASIESWKTASEKICLYKDIESGIFEQFNGYFSLEYVDLKQYEPRYTPMDVILGREKIQQTQVIKQADVVMFLFLLAAKFHQNIIEKNFKYYLERTGHGSSLSPSIYALMAAKIGDVETAYKLFKQNALIDLDDNMGNAAGGVHIAAIGGMWLIVVMGFAGISLSENYLLFSPNLPGNWKSLKFSIMFQSQKLEIVITKNTFEIQNKGEKSVLIEIGENDRKKIKPEIKYKALKKEKWAWEKIQNE